MIASILLETIELSPVQEVASRSLAAMERLDRFSMVISSSAKGSTQKFRLFVDRDSSAQVQALRPDGSVGREVIVTPEWEYLSDYDLMQTARFKRDKTATLQEAAILRFASVDPLVYTPLVKTGWRRYLDENLVKAGRWRAEFSGGQWRLKASAAGGDIEVGYRAGDLMPVRLSIGSTGGRWLWGFQPGALPKNHSFAPRSGTRMVREISVPALPARVEGEAVPVIQRMFRAYDVPRTWSAAITDEFGETVKVVVTPTLIRQEEKDGSWSYDGKTLKVKQKGVLHSGPVVGGKLRESLAKFRLRLDPAFGPLYFGQNPFRQMLSNFDVAKDGSIDLPGGKAALITVNAPDFLLNLTVRERDGVVLSSASLPKGMGMTVSSRREFRYNAGPPASPLPGQGQPLP